MSGAMVDGWRQWTTDGGDHLARNQRKWAGKIREEGFPFFTFLAIWSFTSNHGFAKEGYREPKKHGQGFGS